MSTLLVISVFLPLVGSLALFFMPMWTYRTARQVALGTSLATFALSLIFPRFRASARPARSSHSARGRRGRWPKWMSVGSSSIHFALGLDGISLWLFVLSTLLVIPAIFSSWESIRERAPVHYGLILAAGDGPARPLLQPRRDPLLHLLRVHAHPALLPDRPVRRAGAAAGVDHVFPLHSGGQPPHASRRHQHGGDPSEVWPVARSSRSRSPS